MKQLTEKEYTTKKWWKDTVAWIKRIPTELDSKKGAKPLKAWKVFEEKTWDAARAAAGAAAWAAAGDAAGAAAWAAAGAAAGAAAWAAAWAAAGDAAGDAAWAAAWAAAGDAAWAAAWAAAGDAARAAAGAAAWDAALLARVKICAGLKLDPKHVRHAEERWEANKRGFRVLCDVKGVLYIYRKKEADAMSEQPTLAALRRKEKAAWKVYREAIVLAWKAYEDAVAARERAEKEKGGRR